MNYRETASQVLQAVGGPGNVKSLMHCTTRLRFTLQDVGQADVDAMKQVDGVLGVANSSGQFQVVFGPRVNEVYNATQALLDSGGPRDKTLTTSKMKKQKWHQRFLDFIVAVFQPLVPAIAGGGILKSLLLLLSMFGWLSQTSSLYQVLYFAGNAPLYFLPLLVAVTVAQKLGSNVLVALSVVSTLVLPDLVTSLGKGMHLFGLTVTNVNYSSQVLPAILAVLLYTYVEQLLNTYSPKTIRVFFVPLVGMAVTVPMTLLFLGPAGYVAGQGFTAVILWLSNHLGWVATALLAGVLPLLVSTGMHKPLVPYVVTSLSTLKKEFLYLPASLAHNIAEAGACLAVATRTKDKKLRAVALSGGISALFGVTEPAIYGVTLQHRRVLLNVMFSSAVSGAFIGMIGLNGFAPVGPGVASLTIFVDKANPANFVHALWGFVVAFVLSFGLGFFTWKDLETTKDNQHEATKVNATREVDHVKLVAPVMGRNMPLKEVKDEVFANGLMGEGFAVYPSENTINAPVSGQVVLVAEDGHAVGIRTATGAEVLVHVGIDTVQLHGKYFLSRCQVNDQVKVGDPLLEFEVDQVVKAGYDPTVVVVVTESAEEHFSFPLVSPRKMVTG